MPSLKVDCNFSTFLPTSHPKTSGHRVPHHTLFTQAVIDGNHFRKESLGITPQTSITPPPCFWREHGHGDPTPLSSPLVTLKFQQPPNFPKQKSSPPSSCIYIYLCFSLNLSLKNRAHTYFHGLVLLAIKNRP